MDHDQYHDEVPENQNGEAAEDIREDLGELEGEAEAVGILLNVSLQYSISTCNADAIDTPCTGTLTGIARSTPISYKIPLAPNTLSHYKYSPGAQMNKVSGTHLKYNTPLLALRSR